tara:strand:+ start:319 stop:513 length:195 start_codon:yes stop_codon:yes gene_type:complete
MTYTLSFEITTDTDPAELLELLIEMSEKVARECEPVAVQDQNGFWVDGEEEPEAVDHTVDSRQS